MSGTFQLPPADAAALLRAATDEQKGIAPWPQVDRYPTVLGQQVSLQVLSNAMRTSTYGYRQLYVDILNELLERDPHCQGVLGQRILGVAGGRPEILPAKAEPRTNDAKLADELAKQIEPMVDQIEGFRRSIGQLLYGLYFGVSSAETMWDRSAGEWAPRKLQFIHSRRLSYPDVQSWDLHIWDQGAVRSAGSTGREPTNQIFGLRVADYPGKFVVHTPLIRGDYPTREGLGRALGFYLVLKQLGVRGAAQAIERFAKGWPIASYSTSSDKNAGPRAATDDDIAKAQAAVSALGIGSLSSATLPDSIKILVERFQGGITQQEFVELCNGEMSKVILGQTFTTSPGAHGNRSAAETAKEGTRELHRFDGDSVGEDLERDLIRWIVRLNRGPEAVRYAPRLMIHTYEAPNPDAMIKRAGDAAKAGMPVDADAVADEAGIPLIPKAKGQEAQARRMVPIAPLKPYEIQSLRKLDNGEELEPPPKLTDPSAEAGGDETPAEGEGDPKETKPPAQPVN